MHTATKCQRHDCHNTITQPQNGRRKRFCSDACRIRVHRCNETPGKADGHPSNLNASSAFSAKTASFVTSKIKDLDIPENSGSVRLSGRGIVGPQCAIEAEVINTRDWEEIDSPSGVISYVSRIGQRALQDTEAA